MCRRTRQAAFYGCFRVMLQRFKCLMVEDVFMPLKVVCSGCDTELYSGKLKYISDIIKFLSIGNERPGSGLVYSDEWNVYKCSKCNRVLEGSGRGWRRIVDEPELAKDILTADPLHANERERGNQQYSQTQKAPSDS